MMAQSVNMERREEGAYMRYHEDGLADTFIGLGVLLAGLMMLFDWDMSLGGVWVVLWLPLWLSAKRSITARRVPDVQVSSEQYSGAWKAAIFMCSMLIVLVAAAMVILWGQVSESIPAWFLAGLREYLMVVLGLFGAVVIGAAAWLSGLRRLYAYALLTAVASVGGYLLGAPIALAVTLMGGVVALWGVVLLIRLAREHPVQQV
jgi:hypothetical protein